MPRLCSRSVALSCFTVILASACISAIQASTWKVHLYSLPNYGGKNHTVVGSERDVRYSFSRCFRYVQSFKWELEDDFRGCLCLYDGGNGEGLAKCFPGLPYSWGDGIKNIHRLGIANLPSSLAWIDTTSKDCISVPHHAVLRHKRQRPAC